MQIKIFTISVPGGEHLVEEMNLFLRSKKVLQVENQLVQQPQGACWCFCIKYLDDVATTERDKQRPDYRQLLDDAAFKRFNTLRDIRKRVAQGEAVPAYAVFTDEELSSIAKMEVVTPDGLKSVPGIGEKKIEKYGRHFLSNPTDEKERLPA